MLSSFPAIPHAHEHDYHHSRVMATSHTHMRTLSIDSAPELERDSDGSPSGKSTESGDQWLVRWNLYAPGRMLTTSAKHPITLTHPSRRRPACTPCQSGVDPAQLAANVNQEIMSLRPWPHLAINTRLPQDCHFLSSSTSHLRRPIERGIRQDTARRRASIDLSRCARDARGPPDDSRARNIRKAR